MTSRSSKPRRNKLLAALVIVMVFLAGIHFSSPWYREKIAWLFANHDQRLLQATVVNNRDAATQAIKDGADVNSCGINRWTALHLAAHEGYCEIIEMLMAANANIEARNIFGWTPLQVAVYEQQIPAIITLIQHHADVNTTNSIGNTPLHMAVFQENTEIIALLLKNGASVNHKNESGSTALDFAVAQHSAPIAEMLLKNDADPNSRKTPYERDSTPPLARAAIFDDVRTAALLINHHASIDLPDGKGNTPLHEAVMHNQARMIELLLFCNANPYLRNKKGKTPLELVKSEQIKMLLAFARAGQFKISYEDVQQRNIILSAAAQRKF